MLSPIITPLILIFKMSNKAQEIVDFFRNFTVDVVGVGDVCSFAQMDVRRHGNPAWQVDNKADKGPAANETVARTNGYTQAEDGKTEMSLVHFTLTNPSWKPSGDNEKYLTGLKTAAERDVVQLSTMPEDTAENPMYSSLTGLEEMGGSYRDHALSILSSSATQPPGPVPSPPPSGPGSDSVSPVMRGGISRMAGPLVTSRSLLGPLPPGPVTTVSSRLMTPSFNTMNTNLEISHADMAMSALYLHNINHRTRHSHNHRHQTIEQVSSYRFQTAGHDDREDRELLLPGLSAISSS